MVRSRRLQMIFRISVPRNFVIFIGNTCVKSLFIKAAEPKASSLIRKETPTKVFSKGILQQPFYRASLGAASVSFSNSFFKEPLGESASGMFFFLILFLLF